MTSKKEGIVYVFFIYIHRFLRNLWTDFKNSHFLEFVIVETARDFHPNGGFL